MNQVDSKKNNDFAFPIMTFKVRFYCYRNELPLGPLGFFQELLVRADFKEMLTVLWFAVCGKDQRDEELIKQPSPSPAGNRQLRIFWKGEILRILKNPLPFCSLT